MNADAEFYNTFVRVKRLARLKILERLILLSLLLFLAAYTVAAGAAWGGLADRRESLVFYAIAAGLAVLIAAVHLVLTRPRMLDLLIEADRRLNLCDCISTAYEYHTTGKASAYRDLLLTDAARKLRRCRNRDLFPPCVSWLHLVLGVLIVVNLGLLAADYVFPDAQPMYLDAAKAQEISAALRDYADEPFKKQTDEQESLTRQVERVARQVEQHTAPRRTLVESLNQVLQDVQAEQRRLTRELGSQLDSISLDGVPIRQLAGQQVLSAQDVGNLKEFLDQMPADQVRDTLETDLADLESARRLADALEEARDDLAGEADEHESAAAEGESATTRQTDTAGDEANSGDGEATESQSLSQVNPQDPENMSRMGTSPPPTGNRRGGRDRNGTDQDAQPDAGRGPGDQRGTPSELQRSQGQLIQDKTLPSQRQKYNMHIRSLTEIGRAARPEEDLTRPYRKELETILQKEEIPLNYRDYIKNYFIAIGLREGEGQ